MLCSADKTCAVCYTQQTEFALHTMQGMPGFPGLKDTSLPLRRHGDEVESLPGGYFVAHGRCDDTMNLGGIKVC